MARRKFSFRTFTSFLLAWSFLALLISGAVLYVAPPGRIANWTRWQLAILTKEQWQAVHTLTAIAFLTGGLFHLLKFNWRAFLAYLRKKSEARLQFRNELIASAGLFLALLTGTLIGLPPFATVMTTGASIRATWEEPSRVPPIPHMEEMTLREFAGNIKMEPDQLLRQLQEKGYAPASADELLRDLANRYDRAPLDIYEALQTRDPGVTEGASTAMGEGGRGQGFKTLEQLASEYGISVENAVKIMAAHGVQAEPGDRARDIATRSGRKPYELIEFLKSGNTR